MPIVESSIERCHAKLQQRIRRAPRHTPCTASFQLREAEISDLLSNPDSFVALATLADSVRNPREVLHSLDFKKHPAASQHAFLSSNGEILLARGSVSHKQAIDVVYHSDLFSQFFALGKTNTLPPPPGQPTAGSDQRLGQDQTRQLLCRYFPSHFRAICSPSVFYSVNMVPGVPASDFLSALLDRTGSSDVSFDFEQLQFPGAVDWDLQADPDLVGAPFQTGDSSASVSDAHIFSELSAASRSSIDTPEQMCRSSSARMKLSFPGTKSYLLTGEAAGPAFLPCPRTASVCLIWIKYLPLRQSLWNGS